MADPFAGLEFTDTSPEADPFGGLSFEPQETTTGDPFGGLEFAPQPSQLQNDDPFDGLSFDTPEASTEDPFGGLAFEDAPTPQAPTSAFTAPKAGKDIKGALDTPKPIEGIVEAFKQGPERFRLGGNAFEADEAIAAAVIRNDPEAIAQALDESRIRAQEIANLSVADNFWEKAITGAAQMSAGMIQAGVVPKLKGAAIGGVAGLLVGQPLAGAKIGSKAGSVASAVKWYNQGLGDFYREFRDDGLSHEEARVAAMLGAAPYAGIELIQFKKLLPKSMQPDMFKNAWKETIKKSTGAIMRRGGVEYLSTVAEESFEEGLQELIKGLTGRAAQEMSDEFAISGKEKTAFKDIVAKSIDATLESIPAMVLLGLGGSTTDTGAALNRRAKITNVKQQIEALGAVFGAENVKQIDENTIEATTGSGRPIRMTFTNDLVDEALANPSRFLESIRAKSAEGRKAVRVALKASDGDVKGATENLIDEWVPAGDTVKDTIIESEDGTSTTIGSIIKLEQGWASKGQAVHEVFHVLKNLAQLTPEENAELENAIGRTEEQQAYAFERYADRNPVLQKIKSAADFLLRGFKKNAESDEMVANRVRDQIIEQVRGEGAVEQTHEGVTEVQKGRIDHQFEAIEENTLPAHQEPLQLTEGEQQVVPEQVEVAPETVAEQVAPSDQAPLKTGGRSVFHASENESDQLNWTSSGVLGGGIYVSPDSSEVEQYGPVSKEYELRDDANLLDATRSMTKDEAYSANEFLGEDALSEGDEWIEFFNYINESGLINSMTPEDHIQRIGYDGVEWDSAESEIVVYSKEVLTPREAVTPVEAAIEAEATTQTPAQAQGIQVGQEVRFDGKAYEIVSIEEQEEWEKDAGEQAFVVRQLGKKGAETETVDISDISTKLPTLKQRTKGDLLRIAKDEGAPVEKGDTKAMMAASIQRNRDVGGDEYFSVEAFHGTPSLFDKFSTDFMGSGEGHQAFGWGLYFSSSRNIAEWYADTLAKAQKEDTPAKVIKAVEGLDSLGFDTPQQALSNILSHDDWQQRWDAGHVESELEAVDVINDYKENRPLPQRNLFNVTLHEGKTPDEYDYIGWYEGVKPATFNKVVAQAKEEGLLSDDSSFAGFFIDEIDNERDYYAESFGNTLYDAIKRSLGSAKEASLFLLRAGIDGIKYPAGTLSGGAGDATNYVVFDADAIRVNERSYFSVESVDAARASLLDSYAEIISGANKVDTDYLKAVESGDMATAQKMVDDAAKRAGVAILDDSATTAYNIRRKQAPSKTAKAYKLFATKPSAPGKLFPLFVGANDPLPTDVWLDAASGPEARPSKTGRRKVKSKLGPLAYRPGWHAGDSPLATHIGIKDKNGDVYARRKNEVWAEVSVAADNDYQPQADANGQNSKGGFSASLADIKEMPVDGMYRYKTNPNMTGNWIISGSMKIDKILSEAEVNDILNRHKQSPMPWEGGGLDLKTLGLSEGRQEQIGKLLDPVTRDDQGNIIPLSQRFDPEKKDIRFSVESVNRERFNLLDAMANFDVDEMGFKEMTGMWGSTMRFFARWFMFGEARVRAGSEVYEKALERFLALQSSIDRSVAQVRNAIKEAGIDVDAAWNSQENPEQILFALEEKGGRDRLDPKQQKLYDVLKAQIDGNLDLLKKHDILSKGWLEGHQARLQEELAEVKKKGQDAEALREEIKVVSELQEIIDKHSHQVEASKALSNSLAARKKELDKLVRTEGKRTEEQARLENEIEALQTKFDGYVSHVMVYRAIAEKMKKGKDSEARTSTAKELRSFFATRKGTATLREYTQGWIDSKGNEHEAVLDAKDLNPLKITMQMTADTMARIEMKQFTDMLEAEGLAVPKNQKTVTLPDGSSVKIEDTGIKWEDVGNIPGLDKRGMEGMKMHPIAAEMLKELAGADNKSGRTWFDKLLAIVKTGQFMNPSIIWTYNLIQPVIGGVNMAKWGVNVPRAVREVMGNGEMWQLAAKTGAFQNPGLPTQAAQEEIIDINVQRMQEDATKFAKLVNRTFETEQKGVRALSDEVRAEKGVANKAVKVGQQVGNALMMPYRGIGKATWFGDNLQRMATFLTLKEDNPDLTDAQVGQMTADIHGAYGKTSAAYRRIGGRIFFVHTFRLLMPQRIYKGFTDFPKQLVQNTWLAEDQKFSKAELRRSAAALAGTVAVPMGTYMLMSANGWEPDDEGLPEWWKAMKTKIPIGLPFPTLMNHWKWKKTVTTPEGKKREIVTGINNIVNMPTKWIERASKSKPERLDDMTYHVANIFKWEISPFYRIILDVNSNESSMGGGQVRNPEDPIYKQIFDSSNYIFGNALRLYGGLVGSNTTTAQRRKVKEELNGGLNAAEKLLLGYYAGYTKVGPFAPLSFGYSYTRAERRKRLGFAVRALDNNISDQKGYIDRTYKDRPEERRRRTSDINKLHRERKRRLRDIFMGKPVK